MKKCVFIFFLNFLVIMVYSQNSWNFSGTIHDSLGSPIENISVKVENSSISAISDKDGIFNLYLSEYKYYTINLSGLNFISKEFIIYPEMKDKNIKIELRSIDYQINEVTISDYRSQETGLVKIETKLLNSIPNFGGDNIQTLVKTLPGVASGNELSSNYSVHGGNFDENLVYVNGIEILRPALLQSGEQEGLNVANPDLVARIDFSSGGFSAIYDDKMSSVLDIRYRQPSKFHAGASASLLGASAYFEGSHFNKKISYLTGIRYKNAQYLLKSLETTGEYKPNFQDIQSLISYNVNNKLSISFFAYYSSNNFLFFPEDRETSFGTFWDALNLFIDFEGNERDKFESRMGAFSIDYSPSKMTKLKWVAAIYNNSEELTYDILGRYSLNQLDNQMGSSTFGDSILNLGIGSYLDHARSYYSAQIYSLRHNGWYQAQNVLIQWGLKFEHQQFNEDVNEWKMIDSAGYSIPTNQEGLNLAESWFLSNAQNYNKLSVFFHSVYNNPGSKLWNLEYGIRYSINDLNNENLISPRLLLGWYPNRNKKLYFKMGGGLYYQSIVFREIIDRQGNMHSETKTPFSIQYILSGDYDFRMMNRPFHLKAELYFKSLQRMIPYSVENIKNIYYPNKKAKGYASGIDLRLNGEFVPGVESWLSVSLMKSGINIDDDTLDIQPLPNDHAVNVSLYFQDYVPGNKRLKMYLAMFYLSGRPFGPPTSDTYFAPLRIADYKRVDIGFSIDLKSAEKKSTHGFGKYFESVMLNFEVFNLLGISNVVSYNWVKIVPNSSIVGYEQYSSVAVPNRLSSRRLNIRLLISF
jgi:hypothetical protein